jgi:UPF0755 protein
MSRRIVAAALVVLAACQAPGPAGQTERFRIPPGASFSQVMDTLDAHGLLANRTLFRWRARLAGADRAVQAGTYEAVRGMGPGELLQLLAEGRELQLRFTVPEGLTIADVADLAEQSLAVPADSIIAATRDTAFGDSVRSRDGSVEGFLYPDTYLLPEGVTAIEVVQRMVAEFEQRWRPEWNARRDTLRMSLRDVVALASIVEGEARVDDERPLIAGVYHNRLRIGMALQADPTVQYAIQLATGERKKRLFEKDYQTESPYNTYLHPGLPPGPVNSPGIASIQATLYPADVPYLYFVARSDGRHVFSATYQEHLRAIRDVRRAAATP